MNPDGIPALIQAGLVHSCDQPITDAPFLPPLPPPLLQDLIIPLKLRYVSILTHYNWAPAAMYAFTRLGVADVLFKGPRKGMMVEDIAAQVKYIH